ncbi:MAG: hypothetical protein M1825_004164 [Sarcosagium campestre]|nr:MAG: hypothetical protein M1825_004164 [Sarcosagium campestre]
MANLGDGAGAAVEKANSSLLKDADPHDESLPGDQEGGDSYRLRDVERDADEKLELPKPAEKLSVSSRKLTFWIMVNILATVAIVYVNKSIFEIPSFKMFQSGFAGLHFLITGLCLYVISRPSIGLFEPKSTSIKSILPLAASMAANIVLQNLALAFSSITFFQIVRVLLTPIVALINYVFYSTTVPRQAVYSLAPACIGVGIVSYYDTKPSSNAKVKTTSPAGMIFAFLGVLASSIYVVWIARYHKKLNMNSMQLLFNQVPISTIVLIVASPITDVYPRWSAVPLRHWILIMVVGFADAARNDDAE